MKTAIATEFRRPSCHHHYATPQTFPMSNGLYSNRCSPPPRNAAVHPSGRNGVWRTPFSICSGADVPGGCSRASTRRGRHSTTTCAGGGVTAGSGERTTGYERRCAGGRTPPRPQRGVIDSQVLKTTKAGGPERGYDGAKRLAGRKRHLLVDTNGLVLTVRVHGADLHDRRDGGRQLLAGRTRDLNCPGWNWFGPTAHTLRV